MSRWSSRANRASWRRPTASTCAGKINWPPRMTSRRRWPTRRPGGRRLTRSSSARRHRSTPSSPRSRRRTRRSTWRACTSSRRRRSTSLTSCRSASSSRGSARRCWKRRTAKFSSSLPIRWRASRRRRPRRRASRRRATVSPRRSPTTSCGATPSVTRWSSYATSWHPRRRRRSDWRTSTPSLKSESACGWRCSARTPTRKRSRR
mmetsp:Transcript_41129/g.101519  ORF Transcript_41129/g.101519 Transcript_41129/m.101519 type:complete len:205 (+) Transcript_41129:528-1142(+)